MRALFYFFLAIVILSVIATLFIKLLPILALIVVVLWLIRQFKQPSQPSSRPKDDGVIDAQFEVHYDDENDHSI